jgi:hypothetical protein
MNNPPSLWRASARQAHLSIRGKIIRPANAGSILADIFTQHLLGSGLYRVVEREKIVQILKENNKELLSQLGQ